jgi:hypothetical protein
VCSIRADDHISDLGAAIGELHGDPPVTGRVNTGDNGGQSHGARREFGGQQIDEVRPVEGVAGRSELLFGCSGEGVFRQWRAVFPPHQPDGSGANRHFAQGVIKSEASQYPGGIGAELHTGAHLTELVRLLEHLDTESSLGEAGRGGQAADPATHDDYIGHI